MRRATINDKGFYQLSMVIWPLQASGLCCPGRGAEKTRKLAILRDEAPDRSKQK